MRKSLMLGAGFAALVAAGANPAHAQWVAQTHESAFGGAKRTMAMTLRGDTVFGIVCEGQVLRAVFKTEERVGVDDVAAIARLHPVLFIRADDGLVHEISVEPDQIDGFLRLSGTRGGLLGAARDIAAARTRVAVAMKMLGEFYHETQFGVSGSGRAMESALRACGQSVKPPA